MQPDRTPLYLAWRSPESRKIHPVGRLTHDPATHTYEFCYVRAAETAKADGFTELPEFPALDRAYRNYNLFPVFSNRVMSPRRPDYPGLIRSLGLGGTGPVHPMVYLARTGGDRHGDFFEIFPRPEPTADGCYATHFLVRGVRHMPDHLAVEARVQKLAPGDELVPRAEPKNPADRFAHGLWTGDGLQIGYLPAYLTRDVQKLNAVCPAKVRVVVEQINPPPTEPHHRLLCRLESCWPDGFKPYDADEFQPIPSAAESTSPVALSQTAR